MLIARDVFNELTIYVHILPGREVGAYVLGFSRFPYPLSFNPTNYGSYESSPKVTDPNNVPPPVDYYTDATNTGTVTITRFDSVAHVVVGTFDYTARAAATGKLVHITSGRFNVPYVR